MEKTCWSQSNRSQPKSSTSTRRSNSTETRWVIATSSCVHLCSQQHLLLCHTSCCFSFTGCLKDAPFKTRVQVLDREVGCLKTGSASMNAGGSQTPPLPATVSIRCLRPFHHLAFLVWLFSSLKLWMVTLTVLCLPGAGTQRPLSHRGDAKELRPPPAGLVPPDLHRHLCDRLLLPASSVIVCSCLPLWRFYKGSWVSTNKLLKCITVHSRDLIEHWNLNFICKNHPQIF